MSQMLGTCHLELLTGVHTDSCKLMAFDAVVLSELIHKRVFFTPLFIRILNLFWVSKIVHLGSPVSSYPVEWEASSTDVFALSLEVLVWTVIEDSDAREISVCNITAIKSMIVSITEELVFSLLLVVLIRLFTNGRWFISCRNFLLSFNLIVNILKRFLEETVILFLVIASLGLMHALMSSGFPCLFFMRHFFLEQGPLFRMLCRFSVFFLRVQNLLVMRLKVMFMVCI